MRPQFCLQRSRLQIWKVYKKKILRRQSITFVK